MKKLSFVTTCMGRLEHLKQTLPLQQHPDCESIVVDWSCPDNCGDWVEENYPDVRVVRIKGEQYYHRSKARNAGLQVATGQYICNADADLLIQPRFFNLLNNLNPNYYITRIPLYLFINKQSGRCHTRRSNDDNELYHEWDDNSEKASSTGFMIFPKQSFRYDERFDHTLSGGEDLDMRIKLLIEANLGERWIDKGFIDTISHSNDLRTEHIIEKDFMTSRRESWFEVKRKWGQDNWNEKIVPSLTKISKLHE